MEWFLPIAAGLVLLLMNNETKHCQPVARDRERRVLSWACRWPCQRVYNVVFIAWVGLSPVCID